MLVAEANWSEIAEEVALLRTRCWLEEVENGLNADELRDPFDNVSRHLVAMSNGTIVGSIRAQVVIDPSEAASGPEYLSYLPERQPPFGFMSRLVVCPSAAGAGLARKLIDGSISWIFSKRATLVTTATSNQSISRSLFRRGFEQVSPADAIEFSPSTSMAVFMLEAENWCD